MTSLFSTKPPPLPPLPPPPPPPIPVPTVLTGGLGLTGDSQSSKRKTALGA